MTLRIISSIIPVSNSESVYSIGLRCKNVYIRYMPRIMALTNTTGRSFTQSEMFCLVETPAAMIGTPVSLKALRWMDN